MPSVNAIQLLKSDHERVNELIENYYQADAFSEKRCFFEELRQELEAHILIEESVLYPLFQEKDGYQELLEDAYEEQQKIQDVLRELDTLSNEDEFDEMMDELVACVEHHVSEEEREFLPRLERELSATELENLAVQLQRAKDMREAA